MGLGTLTPYPYSDSLTHYGDLAANCSPHSFILPSLWQWLKIEFVDNLDFEFLSLHGSGFTPLTIVVMQLSVSCTELCLEEIGKMDWGGRDAGLGK